MLRKVVLGVWGAHNDAACAVEPYVVVGERVVHSHSLKGDANKVRVNRIERFFHVPGADAAASTSLLNFFLQVDEIE